jgi:hypothetical protein
LVYSIGSIVLPFSRSVLAFLVGGSLLSGSPAPAQTTPSTGAVNYRLPANTRMVRSLLRDFCEKTLRIGDTLSAVVGPEHVTVRKSERWPKEVVLLLRRTVFAKDPRVTFEIVSAKANGLVTTHARGIVVVEPESGRFEC